MRPWSPGEVDAKLQAAHDGYEDLLADLDARGRAAAQAKSAYNRAAAEAMAAALLDARNADERAARVTLATSEVELAKYLAEHDHSLAKRRLDALDEQVGILRTLSASQRAVT